MTKEVSTKSGNLASVVDSSLLAFGVGFDQTLTEDIKNAYQFAYLVANAEVPGQKPEKDWFDCFVKVMSDLGWITLRKSYEREYEASHNFKLGAVAYRGVSAVGEAVLSNPITDALAKVAERAIEAIGGVVEAQQLLKHNVGQKDSTLLGLGSCVQNEVGEVFLAVSATNTSPFSNREVESIVFEWKSTGADHYSGRALFLMSRTLFDAARNIVNRKLIERTVNKALDYTF